MGAITENKEGTVNSFYDADSGVITENGGSQHEFYQKGAQVDLKVDDTVVYVKVTTPSGNVIITNIKRKA